MKNNTFISPAGVHLADDGEIDPKLSRSLFSVGRFTKDVGLVTFKPDSLHAKLEQSFSFTRSKIPAKALSFRQCDKLDEMPWGHHFVPLSPTIGHIFHGGLDTICQKELRC